MVKKKTVDLFLIYSQKSSKNVRQKVSILYQEPDL